MTPHRRFMREQHCWHFILMEMQTAWRNRPLTGRLDYWGKQDLRALGEKMMKLGGKFIAEAERQEAEHELEKVA